MPVLKRKTCHCYCCDNLCLPLQPRSLARNVRLVGLQDWLERSVQLLQELQLLLLLLPLSREHFSQQVLQIVSFS
jgi:hypothetical protein